MSDAPEYLVRGPTGIWEICRASVFFMPNKEEPEVSHVVAWADRRGAFFCKNEDAVATRELPE